MDLTEAISQARKARHDGNFPLARACYGDAARFYRDQNNLLAYAHTIRHIADIFCQESNFEEARPLYEESIELYRSNLDTKLLDLANAVRPYALLKEQQGDSSLALELWEEARSLYRSLRLKAGVSECEAHISLLRAR
jgi:tetratricopeptide (TPR) repeat protein